MATDAVNSPPLDASADVLVDYLELVSFFDQRGVARLDDIDNAMVIQEEEPIVDDADADAAKDDRRGKIEDEINERVQALGDAYPFVMSDDGEELMLKTSGGRRGACFYLTCLIISHFRKSPILQKPPADDEVANVRKRQFQLISTLAVAGYVGGGAISFGWPRVSGETILAALERFTQSAETGVVRAQPGLEADKYAKDGGMDVIAWRSAVDQQPPPASLYYGQAASGRGWREKSAATEIITFQNSYFSEWPSVAPSTVTVIPFRLSRTVRDQYSRRHGHILDRLRTPKAAVDGWDLGASGQAPVDEIDGVTSLNRWLLRYRNSVRAA